MRPLNDTTSHPSRPLTPFKIERAPLAASLDEAQEEAGAEVMATLTKRETLTRAESEFGFYAVPSAVVEEARLKGKVPTTISVVRTAPRSDGDQQVCASGRWHESLLISE